MKFPRLAHRAILLASVLGLAGCREPIPPGAASKRNASKQVGPARPRPVLSVESTRVEIPRPLEGQQSEAVFVVANEGDGIGHFEIATFTMAPIRVTPRVDEVSPGDRVEIRLTFRCPLGLDGEFAPLAFELRTNDPNMSSIDLKVVVRAPDRTPTTFEAD